MDYGYRKQSGRVHGTAVICVIDNYNRKPVEKRAYNQSVKESETLAHFSTSEQSIHCMHVCPLGNAGSSELCWCD